MLTFLPVHKHITTTFELSRLKPSGCTRCRGTPVAAHVRAALPAFWGICNQADSEAHMLRGTIQGAAGVSVGSALIW